MSVVHFLGAGAVGLMHAAALGAARAAGPSSLSTAARARPLLGDRFPEPMLLLRTPPPLPAVRVSVAEGPLDALAIDMRAAQPGADVDQPPAGQLGPISALVVCTRAHQTATALAAAAPHMAERPAILLLQNGVLGSLAEARSVLQTARPDIDPTFMIGLTTHGVTRIAGDRFGVFHAGPGHTHIGLALDQQRSAAAEHLLDTLAAAWACLDTTVLPPEQIHSSAILKLAINACLNPTVALIGCTNGGLVASEHGRRLVTQLAAELLPVLAHETAAAPVPASASPKALADIVMGIAARTKSNRNSMLVDVQAGRQTEIDYINAYFVQRGRELGISMPTHELIADMVRLRTALSEQQK